MNYYDAVEAIVQHAIETMDEVAEVELPPEGSPEEDALIVAVTAAVKQLFPLPKQ